MFSTLQGTKYNFDFYGIFGNFSGTGNFSVYLGARDPTGFCEFVRSFSVSFFSFSFSFSKKSHSQSIVETIEYPLGGGIHRLNFTYGLVAAATQYPKVRFLWFFSVFFFLFLFVLFISSLSHTHRLLMLLDWVLMWRLLVAIRMVRVPSSWSRRERSPTTVRSTVWRASVWDRSSVSSVPVQLRRRCECSPMIRRLPVSISRVCSVRQRNSPCRRQLRLRSTHWVCSRCLSLRWWRWCSRDDFFLYPTERERNI